jgi:signal peptide peptidase SppA
MLNTIDVERLFSGRLLAVSDRSVIPALEERAKARAGVVDEGSARRLHAVVGDGPGAVRVTRVGTVAIVPLVGLITPDPFEAWLFGGTTPDRLVDALRQAVASDASSILIVVDSPGGDVSLITETAAEIRRLGTFKPITAIARSLAASAAFWIAAQAGEFVASPSSAVGSVGVFCVHIDASKFQNEVGIQPEYVYAGRYKVETADTAPLAGDARAFVQKQVDEVAAVFVSDLARGRRITDANVRTAFGEGRAFSAAECVRRGMVDRVETLDAVLARLQSKGARPTSKHGLNALQVQIDHDELQLAMALTDLY